MFSQIKESYPEGAYTALDLVRENFIPSASVIFRRDTDFVFPNWIYYLPYADWPLNLHHAEKVKSGLIIPQWAFSDCIPAACALPSH